jgi:hypothetical protein
MTRSIVIVSLWLLLLDGIVEAMHSAAGSPLRLLAFYYAISAATVLALWLHFRDDGPRVAERRPPLGRYQEH